MRDYLKHKVLTIALILPFIYVPGTLPSVLYYPTLERLSQVNFERNLPIPEVRDPQIVAQIEELAMCESSGRENVKIVDTNGWYSHSCLQFQFPTFEQYVKRYNMLPDAEYEDLVNMIGDCEFQKELAYKMISESPDNWAHWEVCSRRLGYQ